MIYAIRKWLRVMSCRIGDHAIVSVLEDINGRLTYTHDYCEVCGKSTARYADGLVPKIVDGKFYHKLLEKRVELLR